MILVSNLHSPTYLERHLGAKLLMVRIDRIELSSVTWQATIMTGIRNPHVPARRPGMKTILRLRRNLRSLLERRPEYCLRSYSSSLVRLIMGRRHPLKTITMKGVLTPALAYRRRWAPTTI